MHSRLFRRETSRRLYEVAGLVAHAYVDRRPKWFDAYHQPKIDRIKIMVDTLAEAVALNDVSWYREYAIAECRAQIRDGMPPIVLLAAGELMYHVLEEFLTPDQQDLVEHIFDAMRRQHQEIVYEQVIGQLEQRGA